MLENKVMFITDEQFHILEKSDDGVFHMTEGDFIYKKKCKNPRCQQKFLCNSRGQAYCTPDCNKKHAKTKKKRRAKYEEEFRDVQNLLSKSYSIAHSIAEMMFPGKLWKCCQCGSKEHIEVHHRNCNPFDNSWNNLELRCKECHTQIHNKHLPDINMFEVVKAIKLELNRPNPRDPFDVIQELYTDKWRGQLSLDRRGR